jgi:hypothetical protein
LRLQVTCPLNLVPAGHASNATGDFLFSRRTSVTAEKEKPRNG